MSSISRRLFCSAGVAATAAGLSGCGSSSARLPSLGGLFGGSPSRSPGAQTISRPDYRLVYGGYPGEQFPIPAVDHARMDPAFLRQEVAYLGPEEPGTIVVDPSARQLFFVHPDRRATRYGVGVGRSGFGWSGVAQIRMRRAWPDWIPPREMVARDPEVRSQLVMTSRGLGVPGGPYSPLGARAMYLFAQGRDTGYRIHGTTEPATIGTNVSSGCIRMINQDVVHLYGRASEGTRVIVLG
jgi:lipoprotein-anchoring transpeptidase ErfK/SrfK